MCLKFIILFCFISSAWGYRLTKDFTDGFYWSTLPINITVVESNVTRKKMIEDLAQAAIEDWQDSSGLQLWDYVGTGTNNIIRWSTNFAEETKMDPTAVLAVAIRYTNGPYFARTEIVINGGHTYNQNEALLRTTLTHELGHTMGLDHSEVPQAVMAPTLQTWYTGLNQDDLSGVHEAYSVMDKRQIEKYVSPLAYSSDQAKPQALSCGTIGPASPMSSGVSVNALVSLITGLLTSFIGKVVKRFKSRP